MIDSARKALAVLAGMLFTFHAGAAAGATATETATETAAPAGQTLFFPGAGDGKHASAILLHGYRCIDDCLPAFKRYAQALSAQGIDVYFIPYYDDSDRQALAAGTLDEGAPYAARFKMWTGKVRAAAHQVKAQPRANGRVALVGFSQGARLAIASAADNPDIQALVALYGRLPRADELNGDITALPPTLLLHGSGDTVVPLTDGEAAYAKAQALGAARGMVVYPGEGHGFDFSESSAAALDARQRVVDFVREQVR